MTNILEKNEHSGFTESKMKKFWTISVLLLILMIPVAFLHNIIEDRVSYKQEVIDTIANSWGNVQYISTPTMFIKQKTQDNIENKDFILNNYDANVTIETEVRKKGIFKIPVYTANVKLKGVFQNDLSNQDNQNIFFKFWVKDCAGFIDEPTLSVNNGNVITLSNTEIPLSFKVNSKLIPFELSYKIRGLNELYLILSSKNNKISISGDWGSPSFEGDFLPVTRNVQENSFSAQWNIPQIATLSLNNPKVGVSLLVPVDGYRMADRTLKYSFLFMALTFVCYFIFELTSIERKKIHPLQYCLLGSALLIFYLLLVSISEFLSFGYSYLISSIMIISLIGFYTKCVILKNAKQFLFWIIIFMLSLLYVFLYVLLLLKDFSLLIGSFGMFIVIVSIMFATKNINWYDEKK